MIFVLLKQHRNATAAEAEGLLGPPLSAKRENSLKSHPTIKI